MQDKTGFLEEPANWRSQGSLSEKHSRLREALPQSRKLLLDRDFLAALEPIDALDDWQDSRFREHQRLGQASLEGQEAQRAGAQAIERALSLLREGANPHQSIRSRSAAAICAHHPSAINLLAELLDRGASPWGVAGARFSGSIQRVLMEPASAAVSGSNAPAIRLLAKHGVFAREKAKRDNAQPHEPWAQLFSSPNRERWAQPALALAEADLPPWQMGIDQGFVCSASALADLWLIAGKIGGVAGVERAAAVAPLPTRDSKRAWAINELINGSSRLRGETSLGAQAVADYFAKLEAKKEADLLMSEAQKSAARAQSPGAQGAEPSPAGAEIEKAKKRASRL